MSSIKSKVLSNILISQYHKQEKSENNSTGIDKTIKIIAMIINNSFFMVGSLRVVLQYAVKNK